MRIAKKVFLMAIGCSLAFAACAYAEKAKATAPAIAPGMVKPILPEAPKPPKSTLENLQTAFNGEKNANARYLAFAKKADAEGYGKAASLFRAAARAEQVHFERHAKVIKKMGGVPEAKIALPVVKSTAENLKAAMDGEVYERTIMYPEFLAKAKLDKKEAAADVFEDAGKAETVHANLYKEALANLMAWKGKNTDFEVCTFCGNVVEKINFAVCPICGKSKVMYVTVR